MDALEFIKERNRMCKSVGDRCEGCPAFNVCEDDLCCALDIQSTMDATDQVAIVERWSTEHPRKTRQSVFLEQYPNAKVDTWNVLCVCPALIYGEVECAIHRGTCTDCRREFWSQEVK